MKPIKAAVAVLNQTPLDWEQNCSNILHAIQQARDADATLLCLPELCVTGYGCEDAFHSPAMLRTASQVLLEIVPHTRDMIVSLGLPLLHGGGLFNAACLAVDGSLRGLVCKQNLAGEGIHYEPRWFKPWPKGVRSTLTMGGREVPVGDLIFDCGGVLLGFEICEDAWVAHRPGADLARAGVDVILNPSASHFAFGKHEVRRRFVLEGCRAFSVSYLYANLLGNESGRAIYDGDAMIASAGQVLASGPRFSYADARVTTAVIDVDRTRMERARTSSFQPVVSRADDQLVTIDFDFPEIAPEMPRGELPAWERTNHLKEEEFTRAVALALFDYLRKSRSRGFIVSLSGGADSSAVALLCAVLVQFALDDLGVEGVARKLDYHSDVIACLKEARAAAESDAPLAEDDRRQLAGELVRRLLTTAYQATRNSSETTRSAARELAEAISAQHFELDVDDVVQQYVRIISDTIGRELSWREDDITLQNIQARARSPSIWMLANLFGALLLATSNRSEAAVGYATMDGDTSGGLSPIAGIDKAFLRSWLRWMEEVGPAGIGPTPALAAVNVQQPTAELRPQAAGQTDEDDLMPYEILDAIERAAIRDKLAPLECLLRLQHEFPAYPTPQVGQWVERFFRLWCRNQWKRERYAPSFHLDDKNLDPKTWCRFPILSGGFRRELQELREHLEQLAGEQE